MPDVNAMNQAAATSRRYFGLRPRHAVLTAHIMMSVGLLGDSAGFTAVALRLSGTADPVARMELLGGSGHGTATHADQDPHLVEDRFGH